MAFSIKSPEVDRLARELAGQTGESLTQAVEIAIRERLDRVRNPPRSLAEKLNEIARRSAALPDRDTRTPDEIIGYDEHGLPT